MIVALILNIIKDIRKMCLTFLVILASPFILLWVLINIKKKLSSKQGKKWAFFHPFW